jgi:cellulase/cellobiase CelA1
MRQLSATLLSLTGLFAGTAALAGGSAEPVKVISFVASDDSDYTLVVAPVTPPESGSFRDPYMGHCERFTVMGTYSRLAGLHLAQPPMVTRAAHLDALTYLKNAAASHSTIQLGWMGEGFFISNPAEPCVVKSRALVLFTDEHGAAVMSFYHAL